jgi:hypothetical protein
MMNWEGFGRKQLRSNRATSQEFASRDRGKLGRTPGVPAEVGTEVYSVKDASTHALLSLVYLSNTAVQHKSPGVLLRPLKEM